MYYTIEGKRFLGILYMAGLVAGTVFINISVKMNLFRVSDFLGFAEYVETLEGLDTGAFFSYVCMVRVRQLILFFICLFLFSPYVVYCVLDFAASFVMGMFVSILVARYGVMGMAKGFFFLMPHYLFYGLALILIYVYLFRKTPFSQIYKISAVNRSMASKSKGVLENRIIVVCICFLLFGVGCYMESNVNPSLVSWIFH